MIRRTAFGLVAALALAAVLGPSAAAQSIWIPLDRDRSVTLEAAKPNLENVNEATFSPALALTARLPVVSRQWVVAELPYASISSSGADLFLYEPREGGTLGNPYLGVELHAPTGPFFGELGIRLPLTSDKNEKDDARLVGFASDVGRWEAWFPKIWTVQAAVNLRETTGSHFAYRLRLAPAVDIPTGSGLDTELFAIYSWQIGYEGTYARVGSAISGRVLVTESYGNLGQRSVNQVELHGDFGDWPVRPGLNLRVPLGTLAEDVSAVWGLSVGYSW